jgi:LuxR family transcriptional regulator, maltose regulon positive regulatory protein
MVRLRSSLEHANLFVTPLDNRQEWFRYHHLFADLLQRRLTQTLGAEAIHDLHRQASRWYASRGFWAQAVDHALEAGAYEQAADLVDQCGQEMFKRSELLLLREWMRRLPESIVFSRPSLCIPWAWAAISTGHPDEAIRAAEAVEKLLGVSIDLLAVGPQALSAFPPELASVLIQLAVLRMTIDMSRLQVDKTIARAYQILAILEDPNLPQLQAISPDFEAVTQFNLGLALESQGDLEQANKAFTQAVIGSQSVGNLHLLPMAMSHLALIQVARGSLHAAADTFQQALRSAGTVTGQPSPLVSVAHAGLGMVMYEWNQLDKAREHFEYSLALGKPWRNWETLLVAFVGLSRLLAAEGDRDAALALLEEADSVWQQSYHEGPFSTFQALKVMLLGDLNRVDEVLALYERSKPFLDTFLTYSTETDLLYRMRFYLWAQMPEKAAETLAFVRELSGKHMNAGVEIQALILESVLLQLQNDQQKALHRMEQALALAKKGGGYVRSFIDEGLPVARLLYRIAGNGDEEARRLLSLFPVEVFAAETLPANQLEWKGASISVQNPLDGLVEPLSEREVAVLSLVAQGLSNKEIASRLVISPGTVKVHTNNIYAKLGVSSRMQAAARARLLGILE